MVVGVLGMVLLCVGWGSSAPAPVSIPIQAVPPPVPITNETSPSASASVFSGRRAIQYSTDDQLAVALSPYYANLLGRPAPTPPTLTTELKPHEIECMDEKTVCDPLTKYRTYSGRCNNLQHPDFGIPGHIMPTMVPPVYDPPAVFRMRSVVAGRLLPNTRLVSLVLSFATKGPGVSVNSFHVQMGQFIDHNNGITVSARGYQGGAHNCTPCSSWRNPACAPIPVPVNDPRQLAFYQDTKERRCLPFTRSVGHLTKDSDGRRILRHVNFVNAYLDLSAVYGLTECRVKEVRQFRDGKLLGENNMLIKRPADEFPRCNSDDGMCFFSGDLRVNENPGLTMIHTMFHRAHNNLAEKMKEINPHWNDEKIFQEVRQILIAEFQNLVYNEYLPPLIGYHTSAKMQLIPQHKGYFLDYDPSLDPAIYNEFSTAALRMGHSQVPDYFLVMNEKYKELFRVPLFPTFNNATLLSHAGIYDYIARGLIAVPSKPIDVNLVEGLSEKLFIRNGHLHTAHDLFAINIARGRDHGLAPYVEYLRACRIKQVKSFPDLQSLMTPETVELLSKVYADVRDIDLYAGGLAELPQHGAIVGPTFNCILTRQFLKLKIADRFWFEGTAVGFTHEQLQSIRQTSFAGVLCDTMDDHDPLVPPQAFLVPDPESNPLKRCSEIPKVDLELWRETPYSPPAPCTHEGQSYQTGQVVPVSPCLVCVCQPQGIMRCQCDLSGCQGPQKDHHCTRICGHLGPSGPSPY